MTVLGAGVVGVVTAYYLSRRGHAVTLIDAAARVAAGTSFANAGQLSYSFTDALARPEFLGRLPAILLGRDPGIRVRARPGRDFIGWGLSFLRQCTSARARENTIAVLELAMRSSALMDELLAEVPLEFSYRTAGKLVLLSGGRELAAARQVAGLKRAHGCRTDILTREEALAVEPALGQMEDGFIAAVYSAGDAVGDARAFSEDLADWLRRNASTRIHLGMRATSIMTRDDAVTGVRCLEEEHAADAVVVCLGCDSPSLLRPLGIVVPICPVRGYSVSLPAAAGTPSASITHPERRIVFSRIGSRLRIAGFADFVDRNSAGDAARIGVLVDIARRMAPLAADYHTTEPNAWGGYRPMTSDSRPLVGPTPVRGLYLNTGHGMLGWTLACATGHAIAGMIEH